MPAQSLHPSKSIRVRLGVIFALFSAAVAMVLTGLLGQLGRRQSEAQLRVRLNQSAVEIARIIDVGLYERYRELKTVAELLSTPAYRSSPDRQREVVSQYGRSGRYAWLGTLSPEGEVLAGAFGHFEKADFSREPVFIEGMHGSYVGSVETAKHLGLMTSTPDGQAPPMLDLATPLLDEQGHPLGVLCGYVSWTWLLERYQELSDSIRRSRTVDVLLVDADGQVLLSPPRSGLEGQKFFAAELADPGRQSERYIFGTAKCARYKNFPGPDWTVILRQSTEVAFAPVEHLQANLFLGGLAGALLAGLAGYWIAGIFTRPIVQLADAAHRISQGELATTLLPETTADEVGALTDSLRDLFETRERQAQELRQSFRIFTSTFENAAVGIAQVGSDFHWLRVNHKMSDILGYTADELRARTFAEITYPEDLNADLDHVARLLSGETNTYEMEKRYIRKDGQIIWGRLTASIIREESGAPDYFISVIEDITERKKAEDAIRESETRFREMADHAPVLIWTCNDQKECDWVNRPWREFTGRTLEQERGTGWTEGLHPEDRSRLSVFEAAFEQRQEFRLEHRLRRQDGEYRWMLTQGVPLHRGDAFIGYIGSSSDITENREATESQRRAREAAEAANHAKDEFLAALSHELRTPLNPVLLLASENESAPNLSEEIRQDFATIHKNIALEARLIDDLLDLTRITRGKLQLRTEPTDARAVIVQAMELVQSEVTTKRVRLEHNLSEGEYLISADPVRLQQVFWNVLLNAVKFTPADGWIRVTTGITPEGMLRVAIADSGLGIDPAEMPFIFEKFGQGSHASTPHRFGGLGLGLSIAKLLVEHHNGRIWAESQGHGEGSTFIIELPLLHGAVASPKADAGASGTAHLPPRRILLVEDHEPTRTTLSRLLNRRGHSVSTAGDITAARALAAASTFDLVISDLGLPDGSGHELMAELKKTYGLNGIALSGYGMEEDIQRSSDSGFCAHLTKPVDVAALETALLSLPTCCGNGNGTRPAIA